MLGKDSCTTFLTTKVIKGPPMVTKIHCQKQEDVQKIFIECIQKESYKNGRTLGDSHLQGDLWTGKILFTHFSMLFMLPFISYSS